ncbi:MAG: ABC transporter permease [Chloroflexi bacterium]|nr:ABC transporter permease [Bacteroidota bacterium]MCL5111097.1 ABC transporter permease [Chloroflexota bacterium]
MTRYIIRRLGLSIFVLFGVTIVVFSLLHLAPGDPAQLMLPDGAPEADIQNMRRALGLDQPLPTQYWLFVSNAVRGDLGRSLYYKQPALGIILEMLPATIQLTAAALVFALLIAIPMGILSAVQRDRLPDYLAMFVATVGQATPVYWLGLMLILVFAVQLRWLPSSGRDTWQSIILPAIALGAPQMALVTRLVRSGMLDILGEDYIRTARSKGLTERMVIYGHALKNILIPLVTVVGIQLGYLLGGAVITETIFAWPGVGRVLVTAILARDYPLVQAATLLVSVFFVAINLVLDVVYVYIDPRIRYG